MKLFAKVICLASGLLTIALFLIGCGSAQPPTASGFVVKETGEGPGRRDTEIIRLNNCDGKAPTTQVAERGQSVQIGGGASLGAGGPVVQAAVTGNYSTGAHTNKSQQLTAPPGTNMEFTIEWKMEERTGIVTKEGVNIDPATYRHFRPIDVQIVSQRDLGCGQIVLQPTPTPQPQSPTSAPAPTVRPSDTVLPPPTVGPTDTLRPTDTPRPTPIPPTAPGTTLKDGEIWEGNGWSLRVSNFTHKTLNRVQFSLRNKTGRSVVLPDVKVDTIKLVLDSGETFFACYYERQQEIAPNAEISFIVDSWRFGTGSSCQPAYYPSNATTITLIVDDLRDVIKNVRWQTSIPRS